jgi:pentapeptide MXKDX repeat protein
LCQRLERLLAGQSAIRLVMSIGAEQSHLLRRTRSDPALHNIRGRNCVVSDARNPDACLESPQFQKNIAGERNKRARRRVNNQSGIRRCQDSFSKGIPAMIIRVASGLSAAALALSLALAPAAFAQDKMGKDDAMKKDTMSKDSMKKDTMSKDDGMMKKDTMSKDSMKKDDGMKKN